MRRESIASLFFTTMTKLLLFVLLALPATSCKKDNNSNPPQDQKTRVLSAVYIDNIISEKFYYNADKKIVKTEDHNPDGTLYKTDHYDYDAAGVLSVVSGLLPDGSLKTKMTYSKNAAGQIITGDFENVGVTSYTNKFEYAPGISKQAIKTSLFDAAGTEYYATVNDYNASLLKEQRYYAISPGGIADLSVMNKYIANADEAMVSRYKSLMNAFTQPFPDNWIIYQVADSIKSYGYNGGIVTKEQKFLISERQLDAKGYVTAIRITIKSLLPALPDKIMNVRYEYTEL